MDANYFKTLRATFSESLSYGWEIMKLDFLRLFLVIIVVALVMVPASVSDAVENMNTAGAVILQILVIAYIFLVVPVFSYGADYLFLQSVRREQIDVKHIIMGFDNYLNIILAYLLTAALTAIALIALIVPGIIVACRLAFVPYLVMDRKMEAVAAVEESWRLTRGHAWTIFGMAIVSFFILIAGLIVLIVGIFPAIIWIKASFAALYQAVLNEKELVANGE